MHYTHKMHVLLYLFLALVPISHTSCHSLESDDNSIHITLTPEFGTGIACTIGATAFLLAAAFILAKHHTESKENQNSPSASYLPPRAFWWSMSTCAGCIVTLFLCKNNT